MDLSFFGLQNTPFDEATPPSLFWTPQRRKFEESLRQGINERKGLLMVSGEKGSGKTTFVRAALEGLSPSPLKVISLSAEKLSFLMLLKILLRALDSTADQHRSSHSKKLSPAATSVHLLPPVEDTAPLLRDLHDSLLVTTEQLGMLVVLVIDDAQYLSTKTLEDLSQLCQFETGGRKLLQIVLIGDTTFSSKFEEPSLQSLQQQIAVQGHLVPFTPEESFVYLLTRLNTKNRTPSVIFSADALYHMSRHGKGNPRALNALANVVLKTAAMRRQKPISTSLINEIVAEFPTSQAAEFLAVPMPVVLQRPRHKGSRIRPLRLAVVGTLTGIVMLSFYFTFKNIDAIFFASLPESPGNSKAVPPVARPTPAPYPPEPKKKQTASQETRSDTNVLKDLTHRNKKQERPNIQGQALTQAPPPVRLSAPENKRQENVQQQFPISESNEESDDSEEVDAPE